MKYLMRQLGAYLVIIVLLFTTNVSVYARAFDDVPADHPYAVAINFLAEKGIVQGTGPSSFTPSGTVNRAVLLKVVLTGLELYNADQDPAGFDILQPVGFSFSDITERAWFVPYVRYASEHKIVQGYSDGTFKPAQEINRAEALKIIISLLDKDAASKYKPTENPYTDVDKNTWYAPYFNFAKAHNLIEYSNKAEPQKIITRQELADILYRIIISRELGLPTYTEVINTPTTDIPSRQIALPIPTNWDRKDYEDVTVIWKKDNSLDQSSPWEIYPQSIQVLLFQEYSSQAQKDYFETAQKSHPGQSATVEGNALKITGDQHQSHYYYAGNNTVVRVKAHYGNSVAEKDLAALQAMLNRTKIIEKKDEKPAETLSATDIIARIKAQIMVSKQGTAMLALIDDETIIHTDTIGVGTGPVDYYYSEFLDHTIKYERQYDVIMDIKAGQVSNF